MLHRSVMGSSGMGNSLGQPNGLGVSLAFGQGSLVAPSAAVGLAAAGPTIGAARLVEGVAPGLRALAECAALGKPHRSYWP